MNARARWGCRVVAWGVLAACIPLSEVRAAEPADEPAAAADADVEMVRKPKIYGDPDAKKEDKVVVVVKTKKKGPEDFGDPPSVGDGAAEIEDYLGRLKAHNSKLKERLKAARRAGDDDKTLALFEEQREHQAFYNSERDRLTETSPGLAAGGGVLVGLGSLSFLACIISLVGWGISAIDGRSDDEWGWASLAFLGGGVVGISAGAPMLAIGLARRPKTPGDEAWIAPTLGTGVTTGLTLGWSF